MPLCGLALIVSLQDPGDRGKCRNSSQSFPGSYDPTPRYKEYDMPKIILDEKDGHRNCKIQLSSIFILSLKSNWKQGRTLVLSQCLNVEQNCILLTAFTYIHSADAV